MWQREPGRITAGWGTDLVSLRPLKGQQIAGLARPWHSPTLKTVDSMLTRLGTVCLFCLLLPLPLQTGSQFSLAALTAAGWIIMASECQHTAAVGASVACWV